MDIEDYVKEAVGINPFVTLFMMRTGKGCERVAQSAFPLPQDLPLSNI